MNIHATDSKTDYLHDMYSLANSLTLWRDHIENALMYADSTHSFNDIIALIVANKLLFFADNKAFALMEIAEYPQYSNLHCFLAGGDLSHLLEKISEMQAMAKNLGCKHFTMAGRKGWARVLQSRGWKFDCITMSIPVDGED